MGILDEYLGKFMNEVVTEFYPVIEPVRSCSTEPVIMLGNSKVISFESPNYLSLANHEIVCNAAIEAIKKYGMGTVGSGIVTGYIELYEQLEKKIASWMGTEGATFFNSTTMTTECLLQALIDSKLRSLYPGLVDKKYEKKIIFYDKDVHASILDAMKKVRFYKKIPVEHLDLIDLEEKLSQYDEIKVKIIIVDGYYSIHADISPLDRYIEIAEKYNAILLVDDAHAIGVFGPNGRGTPEMFGVHNHPNLFQICSTAKGLGVRGGFIANTEFFCKYIRRAATGYIFSGTEPPPVPAAVMAAIDVVINEPERRKKILENAEYLRKGFKENGFEVMGEGPIVPVIIGNGKRTWEISRRLKQKGISISPILCPVVETEEKTNLRFFVMCDHTQEQLNQAIEKTSQIAGMIKI